MSGYISFNEVNTVTLYDDGCDDRRLGGVDCLWPSKNIDIFSLYLFVLLNIFFFSFHTDNIV